jgi:hypothetical protein
MADPNRLPLGLSQTNDVSPVGNAAKVCATARLDQHILGLAP